MTFVDYSFLLQFREEFTDSTETIMVGNKSLIFSFLKFLKFPPFPKSIVPIMPLVYFTKELVTLMYNNRLAAIPRLKASTDWYCMDRCREGVPNFGCPWEEWTAINFSVTGDATNFS